MGSTYVHPVLLLQVAQQECELVLDHGTEGAHGGEFWCFRREALELLLPLVQHDQIDELPSCDVVPVALCCEAKLESVELRVESEGALLAQA